MKPLILIVLSSLFILVATQRTNYNICSLQGRDETACQELHKKSNIKCILLVDDESCFAKIESGELDFGSISAEAAFLAGPFSTSAVALAQILEEGQGYQYETVVVTNKPVKSFLELKGFTYCHPGLSTTDAPPAVLLELESKILEEIPKAYVKDVTVYENYIKTLNDFFGPSCRDGIWVRDDDLDKRLKDKYTNLTIRCEGSDEKDYFKKSLECLRNIQNNAIAVTTVSTVNNGNSSGLYYLCTNGTTTATPCVWARQPYRLILAKNSIDQDHILEEFKNWFKDNYQPTDQSGRASTLDETEIHSLGAILGIQPVDAIIKIGKPLSNYTAELRNIPSRTKAQPFDASMKWCTISEDEQKKCEWLSQASLNYGIQPLVECVQKSNKKECITAIQNKEADLVVSETNLGLVARRHGLSAIAFPNAEAGQEIKTMLLVRGSGINNLKDLLGKKGCFSQYGDIAWLSYFSALRGLAQSCKISDFVGPSCMPIANDSLITIPDSDKNQVCQLCEEKTCYADEDNINGDERNLNCLLHGDFAVLPKPVQLTLPNATRILCINGTLAPKGQSDVDDSCYLSVSPSSEIVTRRADQKNEDIKLALLEFAHRFSSKDSPFKLFGSFHEKADLLFRDTTSDHVRLDLATSERESVKKYVAMFDMKMDECNWAPSEPDKLQNYNTTTIAIVVVLFILSVIMLLVAVWWYKKGKSDAIKFGCCKYQIVSQRNESDDMRNMST